MGYAYQIDLTKREDIYEGANRVKREIGKVFLFEEFKNSNMIHF